jgi:hypothetical protein
VTKEFVNATKEVVAAEPSLTSARGPAKRKGRRGGEESDESGMGDEDDHSEDDMTERQMEVRDTGEVQSGGLRGGGGGAMDDSFTNGVIPTQGCWEAFCGTGRGSASAGSG